MIKSYKYTSPYNITSNILKLSIKIAKMIWLSIYNIKNNVSKNILIKRLDNSIGSILSKFIKLKNKLHLIDSIKISISTLKDYVSYTFTNTPPPPLNNVPKRGSSL